MTGIRHIVLLLVLIAGVTSTMMLPPFPQATTYHDFADTRSWLEIPNVMDVLSNLGFVLAGILGLCAHQHARELPAPYPHWLRGYSMSLLAVAAGSIYYHLAPTHRTLVWDRAAMTIAFSFYFCFVLASQVSMSLARRLLPLMLITGIGATLHWYQSEIMGAGDLRFYAAFQFLPLILAILMLILFPGGVLNRFWLAMTLTCYIAAKILEISDITIFEISGFISGHSLKHLLAALGSGCVILAATHRKSDAAKMPAVI